MMATARPAGRRAAATRWLGEMTELGELAGNFTRRPACLPARAGVAGLIVVAPRRRPSGRGQGGGGLARRALQSLTQRGRRALRARWQPGDVVLVKASHSVDWNRGARPDGAALPRSRPSRPSRPDPARLLRRRPKRSPRREDILVAASVSMVLSLFGTPLAIQALAPPRYGQLIREEGRPRHLTKRGTPTNGRT